MYTCRQDHFPPPMQCEIRSPAQVPVQKVGVVAARQKSPTRDKYAFAHRGTEMRPRKNKCTRSMPGSGRLFPRQRMGAGKGGE